MLLFLARKYTCSAVLASNGNFSAVKAPTNGNEGTSQKIDEGNAVLNRGDLLCDQIALQRYILLCCQQYDGGLRDKPSKFRDFYHTCYALSGLSIAQNGVGTRSDTGPVVYNDAKDT